jgi:hypothetical protein
VGTVVEDLAHSVEAMRLSQQSFQDALPSILREILGAPPPPSSPPQ